MEIFNATRKTRLADDYVLCESVQSKAKGLMFSKESYVKKNALLFTFDSERFQSLHMMFVFYAIDVLFLDAKSRVVDMKEKFVPFMIYNSLKKSKYVIELPKRTISKTRTKIGDYIEWR